MIFPFLIPYLNGFGSMIKAPITWALVFINLVVFLASFEKAELIKNKWVQALNQPSLMEEQGRVYARFISDNKVHYNEFSNKVARQVERGDSDKATLLASYALRDHYFINVAPQFMAYKDRVAYNWWQESFESYLSMKKEHPSHILGVTEFDSSHLFNTLVTWITYQFVHGDLSHFVVNMLFLIFFGAFLERFVGSLMFLIVYLGSGFIGAGFFVLLAGPTPAPLVGASAAVSGIMAFLCLLLWSRPIKYIYWLMVPVRGYAGFIYLPAWVAFVAWVMADLGGIFGEISLTSGVAYGAHLGGELTGVLLALPIIYYKRRKNPKSKRIHQKPKVVIQPGL